MSPQPMIIEGHVAIAAAPQRVFDVLADPTAWFEIDPTLVDVTPREHLVLGMTGTMRNRRGPGLIAAATWTTTELVSGARLVQQVQGIGYELTETVTLEPDVLGTRIAVVDSLTPTSLAGRAMVALSRGIMERDLHVRFVRLKALLETRAAAEG